jgi:hypothetical protein
MEENGIKDINPFNFYKKKYSLFNTIFIRILQKF